MGRPSRLASPEFVEQLAEAVHDGMTNQQVAEALGEGIHEDSVKRWKRDPRVQAALSRLREERINRATSKLDARIMAKIETPEELEKMDLDTLLKIRRELLPPPAQRVTVNRGVDENAAMADLFKLLNKRPDIAEALGLESPDEAPALPPGDTIDSDDDVDEPAQEGGASSEPPDHPEARKG